MNRSRKIMVKVMSFFDKFPTSEKAFPPGLQTTLSFFKEEISGIKFNGGMIGKESQNPVRVKSEHITIFYKDELPAEAKNLINSLVLLSYFKEEKENLEKELKEKSLLAGDFAQMVTALLESEAASSIPQIFLNFAVQTSRSKVGILYYFDPVERMLYPTYCIEETKGKLVIPEVYENLKTTRYPLIDEFKKAYDNFPSPYIATRKDSQVLFYALRSDEELLAILELKKEKFSPEDASIITAIGKIAILAMEKGKLFSWAITDALTQLYNYKFLMMSLDKETDKALRYRKNLSIAMCDLDNFKEVNDTYGHDFGNKVLRAFANMVKSDFAAPLDGIPFRYGGDEFIIIFPGRSKFEVLPHAERFLGKLKEFAVPAPDGKNVKISASIGIAQLDPPEILTPSSLIKAADKALYEVKSSGKGGVKTYD